jgi:hypothetical protein
MRATHQASAAVSVMSMGTLQTKPQYKIWYIWYLNKSHNVTNTYPLRRGHFRVALDISIFF